MKEKQLKNVHHHMECLQNLANYLTERSFYHELDSHDKIDSYLRGMASGYASVYEMTAEWLQNLISEMKKRYRVREGIIGNGKEG